MIIALYAALAMILQDILAVCLVQAEARNRAVAAGLLDCAGWLATITTAAISITTLQGNDFRLKVFVLLFVTAGNFIGSYSGVKIGQRLIKETVCPCINCSPSVAKSKVAL